MLPISDLAKVTLEMAPCWGPQPEEDMARIVRRTILTIAFVFSGAMISPPSWADCGCGPLYCKNDPTFPAALAKKKATFSEMGYPTA